MNKTIKVNLRSIKSIAEAERFKTRLENTGWQLKKQENDFNEATFTYER